MPKVSTSWKRFALFIRSPRSPSCSVIGEAMFHSGWFVESLATQTLVLFVIRTMGNPFRSKPSRALTITTFAITGIGVSLPWTPLAGALGFVPLPGPYVEFLLAVSAAYLALVEVAKKRLVRRG